MVQGGVGQTGAGRVRFRYALEAAHTTESPTPGQQILFLRVIIQPISDLVPGATYLVTHPFGQFEMIADPAGSPTAGTAPSFRVEDGAFAPPITPLTAASILPAPNTNIGPFLRMVNPAPPAGYLGDGLTLGTITAGPNGNFLDISGPSIDIGNIDGDGNPDKLHLVDRWTVSGKIAVIDTVPPVIGATNPSAVNIGATNIPANVNITDNLFVGSVTMDIGPLGNNLSATLNGGQIVPPTASSGTGNGTFVIDAAANTLSFNITVSGLVGGAETAAHIHGPAPAGANAPNPSPIFFDLPLGASKVGVWNYPESAEADILAGRTYIKIHTILFPAGEIRGQILPQANVQPMILTAGTRTNGTWGVVIPAATRLGTFNLPLAVSDGSNVITGNFVLNVVPVLNSVTVTPAASTINVGGTRQLTAAGSGPAGPITSGLTTTWTTSSSTIATVDANGLVTGVGPGTSIITATMTNGVNTVAGTAQVTVNVALTAGNDTATTLRDTPVIIPVSNLLANDTGGTAPLSITSVQDAVNGAVSLAAGNVTFTPAAGFTGAASFTYTVSDSTIPPNTATGTVNVIVLTTNLPPIAGADTATTQEDTPVIIPVATLLANDTDPENNLPLSLTAVGNPVNGTVILAGTNITFTPALNFTGAASFQYTVSDSLGATSQGTVTVTVTPLTANAPRPVNDTVTTPEDTPITIAASTLLANDTDPLNNLPLTITAVGGAVNGTVALVGTNITFTPNLNFVGAATFNYTVSNSIGVTAVGVVTVNVTPAIVNPPILGNDTATVAEDAVLTLPPATLLANDNDPANHLPLTITGVGNAVNGTVALTGGNVVFTPTAHFNGSASFTYTVTDAVGGTANATVTVTVTPVADPPVVVSSNQTVTIGNTLNFTVQASDPDGDTLSYSLINPPTGATISSTTGAFSWTPPAVGDTAITVQVNDGTGNIATGTINVSVVSPPPQPAPGGGGGGGGGGGAPASPTLSGTIVINGGANTTNNRSVTLTLTSAGATQMAISNASDFAGITFEQFSSTKSWNLTQGDGLKTVFARFRDASGNFSQVVSDTITLTTGTTGQVLGVQSVEKKVEAEIMGTTSEARVEVKFVTSATEKNAVAQEILDQLKMTRTEIAAALKLEDQEEEFRAKLLGTNEVPPVTTNAEGQVEFELQGAALKFKINVSNIMNANAAHIHLAAVGQNGPVVVTLFSGPKKVGLFSGVLAEGVITAADLSGSLAGQPLSALLERMRTGQTYVNVHTDQNPAGEIRGQVGVQRAEEQRFEAKAKAERNITQAEAKIRFPLMTTSRDGVIDGILAKLSSLTLADVLTAMEFETKPGTKPTSQMTNEELRAEIAKLIALILQLRTQMAQKPVITEIPAGFRFEKDLRIGDRNDDVVRLKIVLRAERCLEDSLNTNLFGSKTAAAVRCLQGKHGIRGRGNVGPGTRGKLNEIISGSVSPIPSTPSQTPSPSPMPTTTPTSSPQPSPTETPSSSPMLSPSPDASPSPSPTPSSVITSDIQAKFGIVITGGVSGPGYPTGPLNLVVPSRQIFLDRVGQVKANGAQLEIKDRQYEIPLETIPPTVASIPITINGVANVADELKVISNLKVKDGTGQHNGTIDVDIDTLPGGHVTLDYQGTATVMGSTITSTGKFKTSKTTGIFSGLVAEGTYTMTIVESVSVAGAPATISITTISR